MLITVKPVGKSRIRLPYLRQTPTGRSRAWFRHVVTQKIVDIATGCSDPAVAIKISEGIGFLLKNPQYHDIAAEQGAKRSIHPAAVEAFFRPLRANRAACVGLEDRRAVAPMPDMSATAIELYNLRRELSLYKQKVSMLERELSRVGCSPLAEQTVSAAFAQWVEQLYCRGSERQKKAVERHVRFVITELKDVKLSDLTTATIQTAVAQSMVPTHAKNGKAAKSPYETTYRQRDVKRFLQWCAEEYDLRQLARVAKALHSPSIETIARRQAKNVLDLNAVTKLLAGTDAEPFDSTLEAAYWRAIIGTLVYAGVRLSEACSLAWGDVDCDNGIISVRDTAERQTKTLQSNRPIKPIPELWPLLRALKPITGQHNLVFPVLMNGIPVEDKMPINGETATEMGWLTKEYGKWIARRLTQRLIKLESRLGLGRQIPMRARRTCRTLMLTRGMPPHVVNAMMGHSAATGEAHYENAMAIVSAAKYA